MILDLPAEEVPHFLYDGLSNKIAIERARSWLKERGLGVISFTLNSKMPAEDAEIMFGDTHYVLSGVSNNFPDVWHSVVAKGHFQMVHDPSPKRDGVRPQPDVAGIYAVDFIVRI